MLNHVSLESLIKEYPKLSFYANMFCGAMVPQNYAFREARWVHDKVMKNVILSAC